MINKIIHFSVYNRGIVLLMTAFLIVGGVYAFQTLPIDAVPDITNNQVQINTIIDGLAPEEIERTITFPIESSMRGLANVEHTRSITRFKISQVTIVFRDNVDIFRARQMVTERLQSVLPNLPLGAAAELGPISTGLGEVFQYSLDFKEPASDPESRIIQLMELQSIQEWFLKPRLLTTEGVTEINTSGGYQKQYHIQPDIKIMASYGIHFHEISDALKKANKNVGGGYISHNSEQFLVQGVGLFKSIRDIENTPIKQLDSFRVVKIKDIAKVQLGKELRTGAATLNGQEALLGTVMMLMGENSRTVALRVNEKIKEVQKILPADVVLTSLYDRSNLVNATLETIEHNLLMGATLVVLILFLLLGNIRAAMITAITIPLALLATFLVMKPLGISGNLMSLGALDFGIIVDGVVILIDNCVHRIQSRVKTMGRPLSKAELQETVYKASVEIRKAAGFGQLIIIVVFIPIFALTGVEGKMFKPMAATFSLAIFAALVLSFVTTPALASLFLSTKSKDKEPRLMQGIRHLYLPILNFTFKFKKLTLSASLLSVVAGVFLFNSRGSEFLPQLSEGSFAFHMIRPVNSSLEHSLEMQIKAENVVKGFSEVNNVFSRIGTSEVATDPMGINMSDTFITLHPRKSWPKNDNGKQHNFESLLQSIIERLEAQVPGQNYLASQPIQMRFNELLEGTRADVAIKVFGPDLQTNMDLAKEIEDIVKDIKGAADVDVDLSDTSPVLRIEPIQDAIIRYGVSTADILDTVSTALGGEEVGFLYEGDRKFPIVIRLNENERSDLKTINTLPVGVGINTTVSLSALAQARYTDTFGAIQREDSSRRSAVLVNLRGRDTESFVKEAQSTVAKNVSLPEDYYIEWGGNFENLKQAKKHLFLLTPLALFIVLVMIFAAFRSVGQTVLIFLCIPFSLVGGVIGLILNDLPFSISAGVGFIALSGIAVLNGIVLVNCFNQLKDTGIEGKTLVIEGALQRLRPVLMTALVAIFGFIPMMISTGVGAEVQRPLASVVIGGIFSSTILTLIVLPLAFSIFENKWSEKESGI